MNSGRWLQVPDGTRGTCTIAVKVLTGLRSNGYAFAGILEDDIDDTGASR